MRGLQQDKKGRGEVGSIALQDPKKKLSQNYTFVISRCGNFCGTKIT